MTTVRPVTQTDLAAAARVLLLAPPAAREAEARSLIAQAHTADAHRRATGRAHPWFGNGTLLSAALRRPAAEPRGPGDCTYLACMAQVIDALLDGY
ncbi:MAG: hypothetical protein KDK01_09435 [Rhodobacteraceae bacterium]|jgi:hypothetical protein|nr:hypothetical protein [Paracoccaceae bacterium]